MRIAGRYASGAVGVRGAWRDTAGMSRILYADDSPAPIFLLHAVMQLHTLCDVRALGFEGDSGIGIGAAKLDVGNVHVHSREIDAAAFQMIQHSLPDRFFALVPPVTGCREEQQRHQERDFPHPSIIIGSIWRTPALTDIPSVSWVLEKRLSISRAGCARRAWGILSRSISTPTRRDAARRSGAVRRKPGPGWWNRTPNWPQAQAGSGRQ